MLLRWMSRRTVLLVLAVTSGLAVSACDTGKEAAEAAKSAGSAMTKWLPQSPAGREERVFQVLKEEDRPHLGLALLERRRKGLPEALDVEFSFPLGDTVTHESIANDLGQTAGLNVILGKAFEEGGGAPRRIGEAGEAGQPPPEAAARPAGSEFAWLGLESGGGLPVVNWHGRVSEFLDAWTEAAGYDWEWNEVRGVVVHRSVSRSWTVNALAGGQQWNVGVNSDASSSGSGDGGATVAGGNSQSITATYQDDPWKEVRGRLEFAAAGEARLQLTQSTGRVAVTGTPGAVRRVEEALRELNRTTLRPVRLTFSMFRVEHNNQQSFDLGISAVLRHLFGQDIGIGINATDGLVIRRPGHVRGQNSYRAAVNALRQVGSVSRIMSVDVPTLNGRPAQFYDLLDKVYVAEYEVVALENTQNAVTTQITPGTVTEGIMISYRAQIVAHDEMLVRIAVNILDSADIKDFDTGEVVVQQPTQGRRAITSSQSVRTGETLVLTGFADKFAQGGDSLGLGNEEVGTGYRDSGASRRIEQVMLVTADIGRPLGIVNETPGAAPAGGGA